MKKRHPTDVSDKEWTLLKPFFLPRGAPRKAGRVETPASVRACYSAMITPDVFSKHLYTRYYPDPDLLIRTSGEMRLSNFLLWQCSYAEIVILQKYGPDFQKEDLYQSVRHYQTRQRRYGTL